MPLRFTCLECSKDIILQYLSYGEKARCRNCGAEVAVPDDAEVISSEQVAELAGGIIDPQMPTTPGQPVANHPRTIGFLKGAAWTLMIGGLLMGLLATLGGIILIAEGREEGASAVGMGIFIILQAVTIGALLLGLAMIAGCVHQIQKKLDNIHPDKTEIMMPDIDGR